MQTRNPIFNETFEFDLSKFLKNETSEFDLSKIGIKITLLDWNPIEKCEVLGELTLCSVNKDNEESNEWKNTFDKPNQVFLATFNL